MILVLYKQSILDMIGTFDGLNVQKEIDSAVQALSMSNSQSLLNSMLAKKERLTECQMLILRYAALKTQYSADIKRLSFIVDGETVMKHVSHDSTCPFVTGKPRRRIRNRNPTLKLPAPSFQG